MLHIINKSPFEKSSLHSAIRHAVGGSTFLLIEDGVYAGIPDSTIADELTRAKRIGKVVALKSDVETRGLQAKFDSEVELVEYKDFVSLVVENDRVQSWL